MSKKTITIVLNLDLLCRAFFCLGDLGSSSAWIGAYCLSRIEKNHDSSQVITFSKSLGRFQCFEECQHKSSFEFPLVQE